MKLAKFILLLKWYRNKVSVSHDTGTGAPPWRSSFHVLRLQVVPALAAFVQGNAGGRLREGPPLTMTETVVIAGFAPRGAMDPSVAVSARPS